MSDKLLIDRAKQYVTHYLGQEPTGHDIYHARRVYDMAMYLSIGKDVNLDVIGLAALLHDLNDPKVVKETGLVKKFLSEEKFDEEKTNAVMEIIDNMSFRDHLQGKSVSTLEGKIVQDADRLDALGAIGIARVFAYSGKTGRMIYKDQIDDDSAIAHFYQKLLLLPELMNLEEAKQIALERVAFMEDYLKKFYQEWK